MNHWPVAARSLSEWSRMFKDTDAPSPAILMKQVYRSIVSG
ncbi:hypothetical protein L522_0236 [Bordetella bronchiseptica MBORD707]|nr:hypothetical protein L522_0236 [Bordetella bronchiseptica MBORD707]